ncbi:MAG: PDZ domain-containing protein [Pirellula sp.]|jgi:hypothetical protein
MKTIWDLLKMGCALTVLTETWVCIEYITEQSTSVQAADSTPSGEGRANEVTYLGVTVEPLHPAFWAHLHEVCEHRQGLLVSHVAGDSPAEKSGIKEHDILMKFGDQKLFAPEQLVALVHTANPGEQVKLGIVRKGKSQELVAVLAKHSQQTPEHQMRWPEFLGGRSPKPIRVPMFGKDKVERPDWSIFESFSLKSLDNDRFRVELGHKDKDGKVASHKFEGTLEEIRKSIQEQKGIPAREREHLLQMLDNPYEEFDYAFPEFYIGPNGRWIWDFNDSRPGASGSM